MLVGLRRLERMDGLSAAGLASRTRASRFANVVFAGGGNRCFWQAGFWTEAAPRLELAPDRVAAVSAGAAIACVLFADRAREGLEYFKAATASNRRNFYPVKLLRGHRAFPHAAMYRETLVAVIDAAAFARLRRGPEMRIPITRAPPWLRPRAAFVVAGFTDLIEHSVAPAVHLRFARRLKFAAEYVTASECTTADALADLILASSCTPPFTPLLTHGGRLALDGGIADNVPVGAVDAGGATLVMLTRRYRRLPRNPLRVYVQPSAPVPVSAWDYTDPDGLQAAFDLGRRDGERF